MIVKRETTTTGNIVQFLLPENEADQRELESRIVSGEVAIKNQFSDWKKP